MRSSIAFMRVKSSEDSWAWAANGERQPTSTASAGTFHLLFSIGNSLFAMRTPSRKDAILH